MIRRRHVFHVAGYDPIDAGSQHRRFLSGLITFAKTWNAGSEIWSLQRSPDGLSARWNVVARADNWRVETTCEHLLWDDIVLADLARPMARRIALSMLALWDFVGSGTLLRYFRASWKYGLFFLYPYLMLLLVATGSAISGAWAADRLHLAGAAWLLASAVVSAAIFAGLLRWPGRRMGVLHALDDWIFARDMLRGRRSDLEARIDRFADALVARAHDSTLDEIVVIGHSMGASLAIEIIARALARDRELGRRGPALGMLAVGSTIPKFTLHPAGDRFRRSAAAVAAEPTIAWAEYQARDDAISFYKFDPVAACRVGAERLDGKPVIRRVQIHDMLDARTFQRCRMKFMRLHYQFVLANERRAIYDYFMMACGPIAFKHAILAPGGVADFIASDGTLIDRLVLEPANRRLMVAASAMRWPPRPAIGALSQTLRRRYASGRVADRHSSTGFR
jgi:hypothetical protein